MASGLLTLCGTLCGKEAMFWRKCNESFHQRSANENSKFQLAYLMFPPCLKIWELTENFTIEKGITF